MRDDLTTQHGAVWPLGIPVSQTPREVLAHLLAVQTLGVTTYIEIGVHRGGLASLMAARCITTPLHYRGIEVDPAIVDANLFALLAVAPRATITIGDVFATPWLRDTLAQAHGGPALVFCDGGDKPRELALAAPLLRPGDYLLVHDVGREVHPADFPALPQLTPAWLDDTALALFRRPR